MKDYLMRDLNDFLDPMTVNTTGQSKHRTKTLARLGASKYFTLRNAERPGRCVFSRRADLFFFDKQLSPPSGQHSGTTSKNNLDVKVSFDRPTEEEIRAVFDKIYYEALDVQKRTSEHLSNLAFQFASKIKGRGFTVADIQGYLLSWKGKPHDAVKNTDALK